MSAHAFYTGLVADLYTPLKSTRFRPGPYRELIRRFGEPALELGCGDGDPLLDLREGGLDVDGIDSSPDMIRRLRGRAAERGLEVDAWIVSMQTMRLVRSYRTIFLAGPTFNLLPDDQTMAKALSKIEQTLTSDGTAVIPLFVPEPVGVDEIGVPARQDTPTGWIAWQMVDAARSEAAQTQTLTLRYERVEGSEKETLDRDWVIHWISVDVFTEMARRAGLRVVASPQRVGPEPADIILQHS
ncbi:MAG: class I SAM-dependent methyltransferase [Candidatus Dormibacteria bacterium]